MSLTLDEGLVVIRNLGMHDDLLGGVSDAARIEQVLECALRRAVELAHDFLLLIFPVATGWRAICRHFSIDRINGERQSCRDNSVLQRSETPEPWRRRREGISADGISRVAGNRADWKTIRYALVWRPALGLWRNCRI